MPKVPPANKPESPAPASPDTPKVRRVKVSEDYAGQRLDNFLLRELKGVPKSHVYRVVRSGEVRVNKGRAQADTRLMAGDEVRIPPVRVAERSAPPAAPREYRVVFEDEHLIVVDKPAGVAVHGGSGVSFGVIESLRMARPQARFLELVHRLDKETSGLLMIAKKRSALVALQDALRERTTDKRYLVLVAGRFEGQQKTVNVALLKRINAQGDRVVRVAGDDVDEVDAKPSCTLFRVQQRLRWDDQPLTLLQAQIKTGRTHQIRVHLQHLGLPIVGDERYGDFEFNKRIAKELKFKRMFLHAWRLKLTHPASGEKLQLEAGLTAECSALLRQCAGESQ
jgi:23S rRNA pseudouridine955/2504/2580 synthase